MKTKNYYDGDIYSFLEENREKINNDYNRMMGSWDKKWSDETLLDFIKEDKEWREIAKSYNLIK